MVPDVRRPNEMRVSINAAGIIALNRKAWQELGEPAAAIMLYDEHNRVIGLKPVHPRVENASPFRRKEENQQRFIIRAIALCTRLGINIGRTLIFRNPVIEDRVLVLSLRDTYEFTTRRKAHERDL